MCIAHDRTAYGRESCEILLGFGDEMGGVAGVAESGGDVQGGRYVCVGVHWVVGVDAQCCERFGDIGGGGGGDCEVGCVGVSVWLCHFGGCE